MTASPTPVPKSSSALAQKLSACRKRLAEIPLSRERAYKGTALMIDPVRRNVAEALTENGLDFAVLKSSIDFRPEPVTTTKYNEQGKELTLKHFLSLIHI